MRAITNALARGRLLSTETTRPLIVPLLSWAASSAGLSRGCCTELEPPSFRLELRREAESANVIIELHACQQVVDYGPRFPSQPAKTRKE